MRLARVIVRAAEQSEALYHAHALLVQEELASSIIERSIKDNFNIYLSKILPRIDD